MRVGSDAAVAVLHVWCCSACCTAVRGDAMYCSE